MTGAVADTTYNGEGHVTGPGSAGPNGTAAKSLTLGTSDGATASNLTSTVNSTYDTFLANTNDQSGQISQQITMKFSGFTINGSASFDYEIEGYTESDLAHPRAKDWQSLLVPQP